MDGGGIDIDFSVKNSNYCSTCVKFNTIVMLRKIGVGLLGVVTGGIIYENYT
jgi:hypothetical protein